MGGSRNARAFPPTLWQSRQLHLDFNRFAIQGPDPCRFWGNSRVLNTINDHSTDSRDNREIPRWSWHIQLELHRDRKSVKDCRLIESIFSRSWHNAAGLRVNSQIWHNFLQSWGLQKSCTIPEHSHESLNNPPIFVQSIPVRKFYQQSINSGTLGQDCIPSTQNSCTNHPQSCDANACHNWHNQYELYHDRNSRQDCKLIGSIA